MNRGMSREMYTAEVMHKCSSTPSKRPASRVTRYIGLTDFCLNVIISNSKDLEVGSKSRVYIYCIFYFMKHTRTYFNVFYISLYTQHEKCRQYIKLETIHLMQYICVQQRDINNNYVNIIMANRPQLVSCNVIF